MYLIFCKRFYGKYYVESNEGIDMSRKIAKNKKITIQSFLQNTGFTATKLN